MTFAADLDRFIANTEEKMLDVGTTFAMDVTRNILRTSPVVTGQYKSSLRVSKNALDRSREPWRQSVLENQGERDGVIQGVPGTAGFKATLDTAELGDTIYISNSTPYAGFVEAGGPTHQAPRGVFRISYIASREKFDRLVQHVKNKRRG